MRLHALEKSADTTALLLERCRPGTPLAALPEPRQDEVVAGLLRRLWQTPVGESESRFRPLQVMCEQWADEFEARIAANPSLVDPGLARASIALFHALPAGADRQVLLATDLHAGNVLAAEREPWLAIDPKPYLGDPTYDPLQHRSTANNGSMPTPSAWPCGWRTYSGWTASACGGGYSPAACRNPPAGHRSPTSLAGFSSTDQLGRAGTAVPGGQFA